MKEINSEEIKKLELQILDVIADFCEKNGLRYYLCGGTLLGAVRHKGFIPWDDDIDILIPRDDYEKFKVLFPKRVENDEFEMISYESGKSYYPFIKVVNNKTIIQEKYISEKYQTNIWVDVFPLDGMPDSELQIRYRFFEIKILKSILMLSVSNPNTGTNLFWKLMKRMFVPLFKNLNIRKMCDRLDRVSSKTSIKKSPYVGGFLWGYGPQEKMPRVFLEQIEMEFEGKKYKAPKCWNYYLTALYGDYMQLPPEDKRIYHGFKAMWKE